MELKARISREHVDPLWNGHAYSFARGGAVVAPR